MASTTSIEPGGFDLNASSQHFIVTVSSVMIGLSSGSVILRFVSRRITHIPLLWDDWLILVALLFNMLTAAVNIKGAIYDNFGTHVVATATKESLVAFLKGLYIFQISYTWTIAVAKLSIIALYFRVFPLENLKIPLVATAVVTVAWLISVSLAAVFSCIPVYGFWTSYDADRKCINSQAYFIGSACPNIITDVILLIIPLFIVSRLRISLSQKIAVCGIFGLGIFGTICSGLRLREQIQVYGVGLDNDPTWDLVGGGIWSIIEASVAIVCACLPSMRPLLRLIIHGRARGSSNRWSRSLRGGLPQASDSFGPDSRQGSNRINGRIKLKIGQTRRLSSINGAFSKVNETGLTETELQHPTRSYSKRDGLLRGDRLVPSVQPIARMDSTLTDESLGIGNNESLVRREIWTGRPRDGDLDLENGRSRIGSAIARDDLVAGEQRPSSEHGVWFAEVKLVSSTGTDGKERSSTGNESWIDFISDSSSITSRSSDESLRTFEKKLARFEHI